MIKSDTRHWCSCEKWINGYWRRVDITPLKTIVKYCPFCGGNLKKNIKLRPVPKSIVGDCVDHHPDRRIYRTVKYGMAEYIDKRSDNHKRLVKAHPATVIEETDVWCR